MKYTFLILITCMLTSCANRHHGRATVFFPPQGGYGGTYEPYGESRNCGHDCGKHRGHGKGNYKGHGKGKHGKGHHD